MSAERGPISTTVGSIKEQTRIPTLLDLQVYKPDVDQSQIIMVIGKAGVDNHTKPAPEITNGIDKGAKVRVDSTEKVCEKASSPVQVVAKKASGNARNTAIGMAEDMLGLPSFKVVLKSQVGTDENAKVFIEEVTNTGIELDAVVHDGKTSNALVVPTEDDRIIFTECINGVVPIIKGSKDVPGTIYLTSVDGKNWHESYKSVTKFAKIDNNVLLTVSPGSPQWDAFKEAPDKETADLRADQRKVLYETIAAADILFANKEEVERLLKGKGIIPEDDLQKLSIQAMHELGTSVSMTNGGEGSYFIEDAKAGEEQVWHMPVQEIGSAADADGNSEKLDFTGAGDSYAAGLLKGYVAGLSIPDAMRLAAFTAAGVLHEKGVPQGFTKRQRVDTLFYETKGNEKTTAKVLYMLNPTPEIPQEKQEMAMAG